MDSLLTFQFENTCRACMRSDFESSNQSSQLQSIFDYVNDFEEKKLQICELLNITVAQLPKIISNDPLPKFVCKFCVEKSCAFYEFQSCCINSDLNLRKLIATSTASDLTDPLQSDLLVVKKEITSSSKLNDPIQIEENVSKFNTEDADEIITPELKYGKETSSITIKDEVIEDASFENFMEIENETLTVDCVDEKGYEEGNEISAEQKMQCSDKKLRKSKKMNRKTWPCNICQKNFATERNLQKHTENYHETSLNDTQVQDFNKDEKPQESLSFKCDKKLKKVEKLKDNKRRCRDKKDHLCALCGKIFSDGSVLRQHILRHGEEKRYVCPSCPKKFSASSDLRKHVKQVHNTEKPFACDICDAAFKRSDRLKIHKQIHTGKRFQCEYCDKRFSVGEHMRRHMRTHTGEKPFKCKYCTKTYNGPSDFTKHLRSHLGENIYQCELCPASFRLDRELRAHFATHKNDDEETTERNKIARLEVLEKLKQKLAKENLML